MSDQALHHVKERVSQGAAGWGLSLALHGALLAVLSLVTWTVLQAEREDLTITLGTERFGMDAAGEGGSDATTSAEGEAGDGAEAAVPQRSATMALPPPTPIAAPDVSAMGVSGVDASRFSAVDPAMALALSPMQSDSAGAGPGGAGLLEGTSGDFRRRAAGLGRQGLDVVLVVDATDSMAPYIEQAKQRLSDVVDVLTGVLSGGAEAPARGLVRFGVVAFKDYGDEYGLDATVSLPLTEDVGKVREFIGQVAPGGGGDDPEPIHRALRKATDNDAMGWRRGRSMVVLLVGDAPVHLTGRDTAVTIADDFAERPDATINTIDVGGVGSQGGPRRMTILPDFQRIATAGKGEAFLLSDEDRFWSHLIVSVFGERFARDVDLILEKYAQGRR